MRASNIQIEDAGLRDVQRVDLGLLLFPLQLVLSEILHLLLPVPRKLRPVHVELHPLILETVAFLADQVLKVHHELFNQHVSSGALSLPKVLLDTVLRDQSLLLQLLVVRGEGVHDDGAAFTAHLVQKHLDPLVRPLHHDVVIRTAATLLFGLLLLTLFLFLFLLVVRGFLSVLNVVRS